MKHPIDHVTWLAAETLSCNMYNPNHVFGPEMVLLERSIIKTGWLQPILVQAGELWIIDGFHRWRLSMSSTAIKKRDGGLVPCALLTLTIAEAMMLTVRINRARGSHGAVEMSKLVRTLIDEHGCDPAEVAEGIGATPAEVELLLVADTFKARNLANHRYSKAWVPADSGKGNPGGSKGAAFVAAMAVERDD